MRRLIQISLLIAAIAAAAALLPLGTGVFTRPDAALARVLGVGDAMSRTGGGLAPLQVVVCLLAALALAWTSVVLRPAPLKVLVAGAALAEIAGASWVASLHGVHFSPLPGATAGTAALLLGLAYSLSAGGIRERTLHQLLGDRVSGTLLGELQSAGGIAQLTRDPAESAVLVCEIVNSDDLLESLPANRLAAIHDEILSRLADFLVRRGAILDACDAQGVRVLFPSASRRAPPAVAACEAALDALEHLRHWNVQAAERHQRILDLRLGIDAGPALATLLGPDRRRSVHFLTPMWSNARRLARVNINFGSAIVISSRVYELAGPRIEVRPLDLLQLSEAGAPAEIYELLARQGQFSIEEQARRDSFWKGVIYFREGRYSEALTMFRLGVGGEAPDAPLEFYLERTRYALSTPDAVEPDPLEEL